MLQISFDHLLLATLILVQAYYALDTQENMEEFDRKHIGVVFSPYVKKWDKGEFPTWRNYTMEELESMLSLVSTKFHEITTYGMGAAIENASWDEADRVGLTAVAAANVNAKYQGLLITATLGMYHGKEPLLTQEAINAISATKEANRIYPNTVHGVALSSFTWMNFGWQSALDFLSKYRPRVDEINVKLGMRLDICDQIIPQARPEDGVHAAISPTLNNANTPAPPLSDIQKIARASDFLICTRFPPATMVSAGTTSTVVEMSKQMVAYQKALLAENPKLTIYWETGWPSEGISYFGSVNSGRNLRDFWIKFGEEAKRNNLKMYMFEAFDEPWKISQDKGKTDPQGPNGGESHFGWWTLQNNYNITSFREKVAEPIVETSGGLSAGVVAGIILAVLSPIIVLLVWKLYRAGKTIERLTDQDIKEFKEGVTGSGSGNTAEYALRVAYDSSYELAKDAFFINEKDVLGSGAFGIVYKGTIKGNDGFVAFKKPNKDVGASQLRNLLMEIKIMIYIGKHENVIALLGAYTEEMRDGIIYIASEWCALGSLESHLRNIPRTYTAPNYENPPVVPPETSDSVQVDLNQDVRYVNMPGTQVQKSIQIPTASLLRWSYEIASGMEYLGSKRVIHADLATRNVLLTAGGTSKITDFGLSRRLYEYTQYVKSNQEPLPWRWMAIESLSRLSFTPQSDIWSYGITLWEIFTLGDVPYPGLSWNIDFVDKLEEGLRLQRPKYATPEVYEQMLQCWNSDPAARSTFTQLKNYFQNLSYEQGKIG